MPVLWSSHPIVFQRCQATKFSKKRRSSRTKGVSAKASSVVDSSGLFCGINCHASFVAQCEGMELLDYQLMEGPAKEQNEREPKSPLTFSSVPSYLPIFIRNCLTVSLQEGHHYSPVAFKMSIDTIVKRLDALEKSVEKLGQGIGDSIELHAKVFFEDLTATTKQVHKLCAFKSVFLVGSQEHYDLLVSDGRVN
ncbi:hypothetical protein GOP47_0004261 [Adiantum capillus-veneris]|uniref:Uncharacterized protein n=1 Tax=Adiantum capillus-veneris TaxID=13818 RepID=A0A9D4V8I7_ADICA|nr:hypothetical protein GOP47_0004261 [Adiantum capillus-veneris]